MDFVTRLATHPQANVYPLPLEGDLRWTRLSDTRAEIVLPLPDLPANHIIVPSFAQSGCAGAYGFALQFEDQSVALHPVPTAADYQRPETHPAVSTHIDCWHTQRDVSDVRLVLQARRDTAPEAELLTLSVRPLEIDTLELPDFSHVIEPEPAPLSQMQHPGEHKARICSPTALTMVLGQHELWDQSLAACYDPCTKAYGSWPLAIRWAAHCGRLGAVEAVNAWSDIAPALQKDQPLVCSIRFAAGQLEGAPLASTGGHLVVLYGVDERSAWVLDPAAPDHGSVARRYPVEQFTQAWLRRRGAAYILGKTP
ncbi:MAG: C39 family peptidase [Pseudomonadota bacterium]